MGLPHEAGLPQESCRLLEGKMRLAASGKAPERVRSLQDEYRPRRHSLHPSEVKKPERDAAIAAQWVAQLDRRVRKSDWSAHRSGCLRWTCRRQFSRRDPVDAGFRFFREAARKRLQPGTNRKDVDPADGASWLHALLRSWQRT